jgi:hypothetical protein
MYVYAAVYSTQAGLFVYVERTWQLELFLISGAVAKRHSGKGVSDMHAPQREQILPWQW